MLVAGYSLLVLAGQAIIVAVRKNNTIITPNTPLFKNAIHYIIYMLYTYGCVLYICIV